MRIVLAASMLFLSVMSQQAIACGTLAPEAQRKVDAEQLEKLRAHATHAAQEADRVLVGTVAALDRPTADKPGSVTLNVSESLKGDASPVQTLEWKEAFIYSCAPSETFHNVGFRDGGKFIVYVKDGRVVRSAAAEDELRGGALLSLSDERALVTSQGGK